MRIPYLLLLAVPAACALTFCPAAPSQVPSGLAERSGLQVDGSPNEAELELRMTPVVRAVQKAADSVISIYVVPRQDEPTRGVRGASDRGGRRRPQSQGSGVILSADGLAITNWHVVLDVLRAPRQLELEVRLRDGRSYPAAVLSSSDDADLALLQIQRPSQDQPLQPITLGDSSQLMVGETVIAIGNPRGNANSVTTGVLSAEDRQITVRTPIGVRRYEGLLQTDAAINQGNSGGALLDITGKLIGVNNAMAVGAENIGYAIPVNTMRQVFEQVLASSENLMLDTSGVWLGLAVEEDGGQPVVTEVLPGGPADRAGIQGGDRILEIDGREIQSGLDYGRSLLGVRAGEDLAVTVVRRDKAMDLTLVPESRAHGLLRLRLGLELEEVRDDRFTRAATRAFAQGQRIIRYRFRQVLRVTAVEPGGPADALGIEAGDVLLGRVIRVRSLFGVRTQDDPIATVQDLAESVRATSRGTMEVIVMRDGEPLQGDLEIRR